MLYLFVKFICKQDEISGKLLKQSIEVFDFVHCAMYKTFLSISLHFKELLEYFQVIHFFIVSYIYPCVQGHLKLR